MRCFVLLSKRTSRMRRRSWKRTQVYKKKRGRLKRGQPSNQGVRGLMFLSDAFTKTGLCLCLCEVVVRLRRMTCLVDNDDCASSGALAGRCQQSPGGGGVEVGGVDGEANGAIHGLRYGGSKGSVQDTSCRAVRCGAVRCVSTGGAMSGEVKRDGSAKGHVRRGYMTWRRRR